MCYNDISKYHAIVIANEKLFNKILHRHTISRVRAVKVINLMVFGVCNRRKKRRLKRLLFNLIIYFKTRFLYSPVRVSISILSPCAQKSGTGNSNPEASLAGFITLPEVSPLTAGSV